MPKHSIAIYGSWEDPCRTHTVLTGEQNQASLTKRAQLALYLGFSLPVTYMDDKQDTNAYTCTVLVSATCLVCLPWDSLYTLMSALAADIAELLALRGAKPSFTHKKSAACLVLRFFVTGDIYG